MYDNLLKKMVTRIIIERITSLLILHLQCLRFTKKNYNKEYKKRHFAATKNLSASLTHLCVCLKYNLFEIRVDNLMNYGDRQTSKS